MVQSSARAPARPAACEPAPSPAPPPPPPTAEPRAEPEAAMEGVSSHRTLSYSRWSYDRRHSPAHGISAFKAAQETWAPETGPPKRLENNQEEVLEGRKGDRSPLHERMFSN
ncbi:homeobox protein ARX-like isoform X2 [Pongo abelii]|uniref:homeobox protein ARX-like isoform X2 n=1 Tax=Pongo abelii TaxID=9601 RepID=UPI003003C316